MLDETIWSHIGPTLLDEFEASRTTVGFVNNFPTLGHFNKSWPKRMLPLVVDQDMVHAIFIFEWICHVIT
jgi:hypothetical protein